MRRFVSIPGLKLLAPAAVFAVLALAADDGGTTHKVPAVLSSSETPDTTIVTLPAPPAKPAPSTTAPAAPLPRPAEPRPADAAPPVLRRAKLTYPIDFAEDSAKFLQGKIGGWKQSDVADLLGKPIRQRPALGEDGKENGFVFAFSDPTGRYREFELDFSSDTGALRTVFVYPSKMTWDECRETYGPNVSASEASKGRKFYSYLDRRMDVLVDPSGKVISLGLY